MRILQVGKYYPPVDGGIENNVRALSVGLASRYEVTALVFNTARRTTDELIEGVRVVRVGTLGKILSTEMAPGFLPWFRRLMHADVIHLHTPNPIGELACLLAPARARLLITYHSDVVKQRLLGKANRILLHRLKRRADRVIAYTQRYLETSPVIRHYEAKSAIIPHGVELTEFEATPAILERARQLRLAHGSRLALFVGRLVYYKGVDVLLRAIAKLDGVRLMIVGDGPMRSELETLARQLGVMDRTIMIGRASHAEKVACYHACDFLVLPATHRSEAFGQVQVEALACGKPVICTNIDSGVPFVSRHEETGFVVEPMDVDGLAAAMRKLFDDTALRERFGAAGRRRAEALFSREVMVRDSLALYEDLLRGRTSAAPASNGSGGAL